MSAFAIGPLFPVTPLDVAGPMLAWVPPPAWATSADPMPTPREREALAQGNRIEALRLWRARTRGSLAEARKAFGLPPLGY